SCVKGQQAYEFERGSVFLQALCAALQEPLSTPCDPNDSLPLDVLMGRVNQHMENQLRMHKLAQTSRLAGTELPGGAPYDAAAPRARVAPNSPPTTRMPELASAEPTRRTVEELRLVPPVHSINDTANDITVDALPAFSVKVLEPYQPDYASLGEIE